MPESHPTPATTTAAVQAVASSSVTIDGVFRRAFSVFADRVAVVEARTGQRPTENLTNRGIAPGGTDR